MKAWVIAAITCIMVGLAVALEAALAVSNKSQGKFLLVLLNLYLTLSLGFSVPQKNVFSFVSAQFLTVRKTIASCCLYDPAGEP